MAVVGDEIVGLDANLLVGSGQWFRKIIFTGKKILVICL